MRSETRALTSISMISLYVALASRYGTKRLTRRKTATSAAVTIMDTEESVRSQCSGTENTRARRGSK